MALVDAILEIAQDMEKESQECVHMEDRLLIISYAKQLRRAVKAVEGMGSDRIPAISPWAMVPAEAQTDHFVTLEREKIRAEKKKMQIEEQGGIDRAIPVEVADGPVCGGDVDGTVVLIDGNIQVGQMPEVAGYIYRYGEDRRLHFCEKESELYRKQQELLKQ